MSWAHYILDEYKNPVLCEDLHEAIEWLYGENSEKNRRVAETFIAYVNDDFDTICISTVFLGIDHGFGDTPKFFETRIFGFPGEPYDPQVRYGTWHEAVEGHELAVATVQLYLQLQQKMND